MRPSTARQTHRDAIRTIALRHRVTHLRVFGSVAHGEDTDDNDLDLLVEPTPETTLMDIAKSSSNFPNGWAWRWTYSPPRASPPSSATRSPPMRRYRSRFHPFL